MFVLLIIQTVGITLAVIAANVEIESIIATGLVLSALSLMLAYLAFQRKYSICLYYGLTTPAVSLFCFVLINVLHWGPNEARIPIGIFLAGFGMVNIPFGILALRELKRTKTQSFRKGPFQFSIAAIMGLTLVVALSLSLIKTLGLVGIFLAGLLCHLSLLTYVMKRVQTNDSLEGVN
jgi:hypothetical protein